MHFAPFEPGGVAIIQRRVVTTSYQKKIKMVLLSSVAPFHDFSDPCFYRNLEFSGGDLISLDDVNGFEACKSRCESLTECHFFSLSETSGGCQLKSKDVDIIRTSGIISGASDEACSKIFSIYKTKLCHQL